MRVEIEYIEGPDDDERMKNFNKILAEGIYEYLKQEGLLRFDPKRQEKITKAINKAREIINRGDSA